MASVSVGTPRARRQAEQAAPTRGSIWRHRYGSVHLHRGHRCRRHGQHRGRWDRRDLQLPRHHDRRCSRRDGRRHGDQWCGCAHDHRPALGQFDRRHNQHRRQRWSGWRCPIGAAAAAAPVAPGWPVVAAALGVAGGGPSGTAGTSTGGGLAGGLGGHGAGNQAGVGIYSGDPTRRRWWCRVPTLLAATWPVQQERTGGKRPSRFTTAYPLLCPGPGVSGLRGDFPSTPATPTSRTPFSSARKW